jgi:hypothetical protein
MLAADRINETERMNRRSFMQTMSIAALPVSAGCANLGGEADQSRSTPTPINDGPGILVENRLNSPQTIVVEIHRNEEEPPIRDAEFELGSGERAAKSFNLAPGDYVVRAGMVDGPIETLFGDSWSLSDTETMYVEVTRSHIYFEEL